MDIKHTLLAARASGTAIGLRIAGRPTLLISSVEDVIGESEEEMVIVVNEESIYGEYLENNCFRLYEIERIFPLRISYNHNLYKRLRSLRRNIRRIRQSMAA